MSDIAENRQPFDLEAHDMHSSIAAEQAYLDEMNRVIEMPEWANIRNSPMYRDTINAYNNRDDRPFDHKVATYMAYLANMTLQECVGEYPPDTHADFLKRFFGFTNDDEPSVREVYARQRERIDYIRVLGRAYTRCISIAAARAELTEIRRGNSPPAGILDQSTLWELRQRYKTKYEP